MSAFEVTGTVDQADVRRHHLRLVLGPVRAGRSVSRGDIVERTGLMKTTVTSLVAELQRMGVVLTVGRCRSGGVGRRRQAQQREEPGVEEARDGGHPAV